MNHDVFISYSSRNKSTALAICHVLEAHRIRCWMAPRDIPAGADYGDVIDEAIVACRLFVLVFSEPASISQWVKGELNLAFSEKKIIIPYRIDETPLKGAMRLILNQTHWVDAYPDAESKFGELVEAAERFLGRGTAVSAEASAVTGRRAAMRDMLLESQPVPVQPKTYKVGDYYDENGKEGVVFAVDVTGRHGKIVGMREERLQWCVEGQEHNYTGAKNDTDGMWNLQAIERISDWRKKYPAVTWCAAQGAGWYLPAAKELQSFVLDNSVRRILNRTLQRYRAAEPISDEDDYWSSTESEMGYWAWHIQTYVVKKSPELKESGYKTMWLKVRAIAAF